MHALCSWDLNEHFLVVAQSADYACPVLSRHPCPRTDPGMDKLAPPPSSGILHVRSEESGLSLVVFCSVQLGYGGWGLLQGSNLPSFYWEGSACWPLRF